MSRYQSVADISEEFWETASDHDVLAMIRFDGQDVTATASKGRRILAKALLDAAPSRVDARVSMARAPRP